jgi:hypothetical protein
VTGLPLVSTTLPMNDALGSKTEAWTGLTSQFGMTGLEHAPVVGSHVPAVWHMSSAVQVTGVPAQVPSLHVSPVVQGLPSLQLVPLGAAGFEQVPELGSQVPATWH